MNFRSDYRTKHPRSVSSPNCNFQQMHQEIPVTEKESSIGTNIGPHANYPLSGSNVNVNDVVNVEELMDDNEEDKISTDDEQEYHEVDDEESDQSLEEEAEMQRMANINVNADIAEKSTEYEIVHLNIHGRAVPKKRRRFPKGYKIPESRPPRDIGTIEKAMRNAPKHITVHIFEPKLGMVFDSRAEAYKFYNLYSWEVGFGIRFGSFAKNRVNQMRTMQEIVCEKEGFDKRCKNNSKRMHCKDAPNRRSRLVC
ncbi:uncharacterized protein [Miscanthus floridulus]|uniref:uncharacterized protein isoform X2 n=1 Tax=Miscanthus floridulus TaxID=154761 RepID=UPI00345792DF